MLAAPLASRIEDRDAIDTAVIAALTDHAAVKSWKQTKFAPCYPVSKRAAATVTDAGGKTVEFRCRHIECEQATRQPSAVTHCATTD